MTKAEAIRILEQSCPKRPQKLWSIKRKEALNMAIEALNMAIEALNFVSEHHQSNIETYAHDMGVSLEQAERELRVEELSCSAFPNRSDLVKESGDLVKDLVKDCISRQATIDAIDKHIDTFDAIDTNYLCGLRTAMSFLKEMPSAQPEPLDDGTLMMTVPNGMLNDVKRVMVDEVGTKFCKVMYQDEPERKKGEWIIDKDCEGKSRTVTCNRCGHNEFNWHNPNFCPNCGAEMG